MKKYLLIVCVLIASCSACKKSDNFDASAQAATDDANIQAYLKAKSITATKDPSGLYYQVVTPGTGAYPTSASTVTVNYSGKLLDGTAFDSSNGFVTPLTSVIAGWTIGIPHINVGGRIILFIPSGLGYKNSSAGSIPANSVLIFTVDLIGFK
jgi:FKBP-type peptidyl-prolyl cis-trans isomerase FkpA